MVPVGVPKLGYTSLIFFDPGVKINGAYYRDVLLSQQLLPAIYQVYGEFFIFQRTGARDDQPPWARDSCIHLDRFVVAQQPRPQSSWLQSGYNAAASLPDKNAGCRQFEAVSDWWLGWNETKRYLRCHRPVVQESPYLHAGQRRTFWILTVTHKTVKAFASFS